MGELSAAGPHQVSCDPAPSPPEEHALAPEVRDVLELTARTAPPEPLPRSAGSLCRGVVVGERGVDGRRDVRIEGALWQARQAESCLIAPEAGDVVLVSLAPGQPSYVLAVLERRGSEARTVRAPGGEPLRVSAERIELAGEQAVSVRAPALDLVARTATLAFRAATVTGDLLRGASERLEWVGRHLQTVADSSAHRAGTYVRSVTSADTVVAEHMVRTAHQTMTSSTTHSILDAGEDVHIHGKRIHMR